MRGLALYELIHQSEKRTEHFGQLRLAGFEAGDHVGLGFSVQRLGFLAGTENPLLDRVDHGQELRDKTRHRDALNFRETPDRVVHVLIERDGDSWFLCGHLVMHSMQSDAPNVRTPKAKGNPCGLFTGATVQREHLGALSLAGHPSVVRWVAARGAGTQQTTLCWLYAMSATCFPLSVEP